jgi:hypothetical protein
MWNNYISTKERLMKIKKKKWILIL